MHCATLGLFGNHIVKSVIHKIETTLRNDSYITGYDREGRPKYVISKAALDAVHKRMCERLEHFNSSESGFQLTSKYTAHVRHVFIHGKSTFTAGRLEFLMMALPFVLRDLIDQELEVINQALRDGKVVDCDDGEQPEPPNDPCPDMINAFALFLDWYLLARMLLFVMSMAAELQRRCTAMKEALKIVFPDKSGQQAAWGFPKFHGPVHGPSEILGFGTTAYTDTQIFEKTHRPNVKDLAGNSNQKQVFMCVCNHHERGVSLSKLKQATSRHSKYLSRIEEGDGESDLDSESGSADQSDDDLFLDEHTSRPCEIAAKMPLWSMVTNPQAALHREPFCLGKMQQGLQRLVLAACKAGAPAIGAKAAKGGGAANRGQSSQAKFVYNPAKELPSLAYLPRQLVHFAYEYLTNRLGLEYKPEEERDIDSCLDTYIVQDKDKCDIFTFGGIAIRSDDFKGTVRVRARPFPDDKFHGRNPQVLQVSCASIEDLLMIHVLKQDAVLCVPGRPEWKDSVQSFDGSNEDHLEDMWTCKVVLFFKCTFKRPGAYEPFTCLLALVNRLRYFDVAEARKHCSIT